jgi:hypothetical protein
MTPEELEQKLLPIYKHYDIENGVYTDERDCLQPCCYDDYKRDVQAAAEINAVWPEAYAGVGEIPSVAYLMQRLKVNTCKHEFVAKGSPSFTSAGWMGQFIECIHCKRGGGFIKQ